VESPKFEGFWNPRYHAAAVRSLERTVSLQRERPADRNGEARGPILGRPEAERRPVDDRDAYYGNPEYGVIMAFLRGERPDWEGRWLAEMREWDNQQMEADHHYIQWLFPLLTESQAVFAPRLRAFEIEALRSDPLIREELLVSFRRFVTFLGFELTQQGSEIRMRTGPRFCERNSVWLHPGNHNYLRISRVLGSLTLAGLDAFATSLLDALVSVAATPEGQRAIDDVSLRYWRQRAQSGQQLGAAQARV
jgi:hypothetical protein